jgi:hypothetical protein
MNAVLAATTGGGRRTVIHNSPCEERGIRTVQTATWLRLLDGALPASVPARSGTPQRYQAVIHAASRWALRALLDGGVNAADMNDRLISHYPEYFAPGPSGAASYHKRLSRARQDICDLLASIIGRDELLP